MGHYIVCARNVTFTFYVTISNILFLFLFLFFFLLLLLLNNLFPSCLLAFPLVIISWCYISFLFFWYYCHIPLFTNVIIILEFSSFSTSSCKYVFVFPPACSFSYSLCLSFIFPHFSLSFLTVGMISM